MSILARNDSTRLRCAAASAILVFLAAVTLGSCENGGSASASRECQPGDEATCQGDASCVGLQECEDDGHWSPCNCNPTGTALLGSACSDDTSCPTGATCLLPNGTSWLGGGPPQGFCVADCTGEVARCNHFANAVCVSAAPSGAPPRSLCMPKCDLSTGTKDTLACSAVAFSACEPLDKVNAGFCRPFCLFDADCPTGHCDRGVGACVAAPPPSKPAAFGDTCDPRASTCSGFCLKLSANASICSNRCIFGVYTECAVAGADPIVGVCAYAATAAKPGNIGYCTPLCNCNDDCRASGFVCQAFSTEDTQRALAHVGMCIPSFDAAGLAHEGVACAN